MNKKCSVCKDEKSLVLFNKSKSSKDGHRSNCKECSALYRIQNKDKTKKYRENNKEKFAKYFKERNIVKREELSLKAKENYLKNCESRKIKAKEYYYKNKESKIRYQKEYQKNNKERRNKYLKERRNSDPLFNMVTNVRNLIYNSFYYNGYSKDSKTENILGCSFIDFKKYLQLNFKEWMTWENKGLYNGKLMHGWDIDHTIPLSTANNKDEIIKLNHYTNLKPLCSKINRDIKKNNIEHGNI